MLEEQHLVSLLVKIAVAASVASILMRFRRIQRILLNDERTIGERLQLALILSVIFGAGETARIITPNQYQAIDLALESAIIAGMLAGYVSGMVTGLCVSIPALLAGERMSMPFFAAAGVLGGLMHDLASEKEDIWYYSAFIDLNLYRVAREAIRRGTAFERRAIQRSAYNLVCNAAIVTTEFLRIALATEFPVHGTFSIARTWSGDIVVHFVALAATTLFCVSIPIRIWATARAEKKLAAQQARLTEARLAALTNQINPHFLFNTLNSVATLVRLDPDKARSMIYKLSNILRRLLRQTDSFSPLRDEIKFIDDYLGIELIRFGDKLRFEKTVDDDVLDRLAPSMILQPIIENSIKHGLGNKVGGGTIWLRIWCDASRLYMVVEDDGVGIEETKLMKLFEQGIGVSNVNERLKVLFESNYRFTVDSAPGKGTKTTIEIPVLDIERPSTLTKTDPG
jgi:Putative regulator of cell autolysis